MKNKILTCEELDELIKKEEAKLKKEVTWEKNSVVKVSLSWHLGTLACSPVLRGTVITVKATKHMAWLWRTKCNQVGFQWSSKKVPVGSEEKTRHMIISDNEQVAFCEEYTPETLSLKKVQKGLNLLIKAFKTYLDLLEVCE